MFIFRVHCNWLCCCWGVLFGVCVRYACLVSKKCCMVCDVLFKCVVVRRVLLCVVFCVYASVLFLLHVLISWCVCWLCCLVLCI